MESQKNQQTSFGRIISILEGEQTNELLEILERNPAGCPGLERLLLASSNPQTFIANLTLDLEEFGLLMRLMGCLPAITDILAQNPEIVTVLNHAPCQLNLESLFEYGRRLLSNAHSTDHKYDRLRLIKQQWMVFFAGQELVGESAEIGCSLVAEVLTELNHEIIWNNLVRDRGVSENPCFGWIAFGKLGSSELNISSDIDLVGIADDSCNDEDLLHAQRAAATLGRSMTQPMGRGMLYRVDQGLRPFGGSGPLVHRFSAIEAYYRNYAESWELFALLRSRGLGTFADKWNSLRHTICFGSPKGIWRLEEVIAQRKRTEEHFSKNDIKRGAGGIRDIEFLAYGMQMIYGFQRPELQPLLCTRQLLKELEKCELLQEGHARILIENYSFFRMIEHALQWKLLQQTHTLPESEEAWDELSIWVTGTRDGEKLRDKVQLKRNQTREIYSIFESGLGVSQAHISSVNDLVNDYLLKIPGCEMLAVDVAISPIAHSRFELILDRAPVLAKRLIEFPNIIEQIYSGEIEEKIESKVFSSLSKVRQHCLHLWYQVFLNRSCCFLEVKEHISRSLDQFIIGNGLHAILLGSFLGNDWLPGSDVDCVIWSEAEVSPQQQLELAQNIQLWNDKLGDICAIDLRLRPEGRGGPIVRSREAILNYALTEMEWWEVMAFAQFKALMQFDIQSEKLIREIIGSRKFDIVAFEEIEMMRQRILIERVGSNKSKLNLKLGSGGISSYYWVFKLSNLCSLLPPDDAESREAFDDICKIRCWLRNLGENSDEFPESSFVLTNLAKCMQISSIDTLEKKYFKAQLEIEQWVTENLVKIRSGLE